MTRLPEDNPGGKDQDRHWRLTKERILMWAGLFLIAAEFINAELRNGTFHVEFLIGGLALCGISIASWGDKR